MLHWRGADMADKPSLMPVIATTGCMGHVRPTAKGFVAYDQHDKPIGLFSDSAAAIVAVLTAIST
jgi:hypothetical protein